MAGCSTTIERLQREHPAHQEGTVAAAVSRDMHLRVEYGELQITLMAEAVSYAPDVLHDMRTQIVAMLRDALAAIADEDIADSDDTPELLDESVVIVRDDPTD